eukprot:sb/3475736/
MTILPNIEPKKMQNLLQGRIQSRLWKILLSLHPSIPDPSIPLSLYLSIPLSFYLYPSISLSLYDLSISLSPSASISDREIGRYERKLFVKISGSLIIHNYVICDDIGPLAPKIPVPGHLELRF